MRNWTNQKIKYREYKRQWVDIETGECITEEEFNKNYYKIKTENKKEYGKEKCITTSTKIGRRINQTSIW